MKLNKTKGTMAKELTPIKVETLPNGYSLTVYQKSYLYFDEMELF